MRSVLRSNDVQEESEETDGLVSTFSSCNSSLRSMAQEGQREWMIGGEKMKMRDDEKMMRRTYKKMNVSKYVLIKPKAWSG